MWPVIMPLSSRCLTLRAQGVGDKFTLSASSRLLIRAFDCNSWRMCLSILSNFVIFIAMLIANLLSLFTNNFNYIGEYSQ